MRDHDTHISPGTWQRRLALFERARLIGRPLLISIVVFAAVAAVAGAAGSGITTGCVAKATGALRIIGPTGSCSGSEAKLTWNQQGVPGPQGPQGPQGEPAPTAAPVSCVSCQDFAVVDLPFANLANANLQGANFYHSNLPFANLANAELANADFSVQRCRTPTSAAPT